MNAFVLLSLVAASGSGAVAGPVQFTLQDVAGGAEPATDEEAQEEAEEEEKKPMFAGFAWEGHVTAGLTILGGNTRSKQFSLDGEAVGRGEDDRLTLKAGYLSARQKDPNTGVRSTTARRSYGSAKFDRFFSEKWYGYLLASAEKDAIRQLDLLYHLGGGTGYQWIESDVRNLFTEAGLGYTKEDYEVSTSDTDYLSARVALHYDTKLGETASFFHDSEWLPSLKDFNDDQIVHTVTGVRTQIAGNLSGEAKVIFDWDSSPAPGRGRHDVTYILGLTWTF